MLHEENKLEQVVIVCLSKTTVPVCVLAISTSRQGMDGGASDPRSREKGEGNMKSNRLDVANMYFTCCVVVSLLKFPREFYECRLMKVSSMCW